MCMRLSRCGSSINVAVVVAALLLLASQLMTGLANTTSTTSADSEQQPQAPEKNSAPAKKSLDIGAATHGRRLSSTRSSWCNVDVVEFGDPDASDTASEKQRPKAKLGISIQNLLNKLRKKDTCRKKTTNDASTGRIALPPKTIAQSTWIRRIPTDAETTTKTPPPITIQDIKSWHFDPLQHTAEALSHTRLLPDATALRPPIQIQPEHPDAGPLRTASDGATRRPLHRSGPLP